MDKPETPPFDEKEVLLAILRRQFDIDSNVDLLAIETGLSFRNLSAGETLFEQGEAGASVCFVLSGRLRTSRRGATGQVEILGEIGRGETVGELAFLTDTVRSATVIALRDTRIACFARAAFETLLARQPRIATSMIRLVIDRFRMQEQGRHVNSRPVTIAVVKASPSVDLPGFVRRLAAARRQHGGRCEVLQRSDFASGPAQELEFLVPHGTAATLIHQRAASCDALFLVAQDEFSAWTERCIEAADEILLVGSAVDESQPSAIERQMFERGNPLPRARQTLVLLHAPASQGPRATDAWINQREVRRHFHVRLHLDRDVSRLARILAGRAVGVVLSGGGARGLAQIGTLRALAEMGIDADFVGGTSMGAIISALAAMDLRGAALIGAGRKALRRGVTSDYNWLPIVSLFRGVKAEKALRTLIADAMGSEDIGSEDLWRSHFCIASNFSTGSEAVLRRGLLWRNLMASSAIPGLFAPQIIDGHLMFDGGTFNNFPVDAMEQQEAGAIIGVDLLGNEVRTYGLDRVPSTARVLAERLRPRAQRRHQLPSLPQTLLAATVVTSHAKQRMMRARVDLHLTPPVDGVGLLDWNNFDKIVQAGFDYTRRRLEELPAEQLKRFQ
jgi:NTE family protein